MHIYETYMYIVDNTVLKSATMLSMQCMHIQWSRNNNHIRDADFIYGQLETTFTGKLTLNYILMKKIIMRTL